MKKFLAVLLGIFIFLGAAIYYIHLNVYASGGTPKVESQQQLKHEILKNLNEVKPDFTIQTKYPIYKAKEAEQQLKSVFKEISSVGNYGFGNLDGYSYYISSNMGFTKIEIKTFYLTTADQEKKMHHKVKKIIQNNHVQKMTDFEKVFFINGYLASHIEYSEDATHGGHSAYAALFDHKAVCQGYALAADLLLRESGLQTKYITGKVKGENHAWNKVKLDGKWYNLDITWNDPMPDRGERYRLNYFLISDNQLAKDHMWNYDSLFQAKSKKYEGLMNAQAFTVDNNNVFYTLPNDSNLYKWNTTTRQKSVLLQHVMPLQNIEAKDHWLLLKDYTGNMSKVKEDGTQYSGTIFASINQYTESASK